MPEQQRGLASEIMGFMMIAGSIVGVVAAGLFVNATLPLPLYRQGLWSGSVRTEVAENLIEQMNCSPLARLTHDMLNEFAPL
ncbi:hypothetical protein [Dictyobacter aurantiacus]|uniref:Uncharacterized protein n=1 Tax=Dictyobacter aurantiacus TaxID=1936993 RepID=A0A401ZLR8_9CHLR|nr:hypothetical protein [Dictyobacter aurantiacus]GCE07803.1 hypothetical protein KDAU_51320 [Dictyobacter aurantiacus]